MQFNTLYTSTESNIEKDPMGRLQKCFGAYFTPLDLYLQYGMRQIILLNILRIHHLSKKKDGIGTTVSHATKNE